MNISQKYFMKNKEIAYTVVAVLIATCVIVLSFTLPAIFSKPTQTAFSGDVHALNVSVRGPKTPSQRGYEAGELVSFNAFISFRYCGNSWGSPAGQISRPVPYGTAHTGMTSAIQKGAVLSKIATGGNDQNRYQYTGQYAQNFTAPTRPGKYWFRYKIGVKNGQGTDKYTEGVRVFKVLPRDLCSNMPGRQDRVPSSRFQTINARGEPICLEYGNRTLICRASKNPIVPSESVEYSAQTASGQAGDFAWYNGGSTYGTVVKKDTNKTRSTYSRSYASPGTYLVSVLAEVDGKLDKCVMGVTVQGDGEEEVKLDIGDGNGAVDIDESRIFIDGDEIFYLDPSAGAGVIDFDMAAGFTNDTCRATWNTQNVLKCDLYKNNEFFEKLEKQGEKDLGPGIYQIRCLQLQDGSEVVSEAQTCRMNPNIREV